MHQLDTFIGHPFSPTENGLEALLVAIANSNGDVRNTTLFLIGWQRELCMAELARGIDVWEKNTIHLTFLFYSCLKAPGLVLGVANHCVHCR